MTDPLLPQTPLQGPPQLTNCDREPIHIPGSVQPHGAMLAFHAQSKRIQYVSANIESFTGRPIGQLLGQNFADCFPQHRSLVDQLANRAEGHSVTEELKHNQQQLLLTAHRCDDMILLEWEPVSEYSGGSDGLIQRLFAQLNGCSLSEAYSVITNQIQQHIDFDRVMLYQFQEDGHGVVIAESKRDNMEPFLGLHYPASDIPQPARRLYELNWLRQIADVNAEPVSLIAESENGQQPPLNMTYAKLRAISPIHVEYLKNMQVGASLSISIMDGQKLWGLIACHHNSAKYITGAARDACELVGTVLSAYLSSRQQQDYLQRQTEINQSINEQLRLLNRFDDIEAGLERAAPELCRLLESDGMVWQTTDDQFCWGEVPNQQAIAQVVSALDSRSMEKIAYTDHLSAWLSVSQTYSDRCSGMLAIRLGQLEAGLLIFFRRPYHHNVLWGGDPTKSKVDEHGRLTPRKSFAAWKQSVEDRSQPWSRRDLETARALTNGLRSMIVEQGSRLRRMNEELRRLNTDLDAFAYAASHDLKEPLRGLHHYVYMLEHIETKEDEEFEQGISGLKRILKRMGDLLDGLLRFSRAGRSELQIESFPLSEIVEQAKDILFAGQFPENVEITLENDRQIAGDFACVREVVVNLISNGIKYNESEKKEIRIGCLPMSSTPLRRRVGDLSYAVYVRDNGIGIAPEHLTQIFDIFTRLHDRDSYGGGSGAGLTIVRRLVERHGGSIVAESESTGTSFYFCLGESE